MNQLDPRPYLERIQPGLVPIAAGQPGVCGICRSGADGDDRCWRCSQEGIVPVLPISMSVHSEALHQRLRWYKDGQPPQRREHTLELAALLVLFLGHHLGCLGGAPDLVVTVPSRRRDAVKGIEDQVGWLSERHTSLSAVGTKDLPQFEVDGDVRGKQVLLLDDTFTRGRSITAASRALSGAGADGVRALVIGRHFHPGYDTSVELWECLKRHTWRLDRCGICGPIHCSGSSNDQRRML